MLPEKKKEKLLVLGPTESTKVTKIRVINVSMLVSLSEGKFLDYATKILWSYWALHVLKVVELELATACTTAATSRKHLPQETVVLFLFVDIVQVQ